MKKIFFAAGIFLILITGIFFVSSKTSQVKVSEEVYNALEKNNDVRVIVKLKEPSREKGFLFKIQKTDFEIKSEKQEIKENVINEIGKENIKHIFEKEIAIEVSKEKLNELEHHLDIESIIIDKPIHAFLQDSVPHINASSVWPIQISGINLTGIDETICILDTGINFSHPDLIGKNKTCVIDCVGKACVENCSIEDDNGHGTHVAGIAAASLGINGVAIGANLIGVKVLNSAGEGVRSDLNAGIDWCIISANAYNISVISMSLGDCTNHSTYCNGDSSASHINNATWNNISIIVSAGNGPGGTCSGITNIDGPAAPACVENATAVGAVNDIDDSIFYQRGALFELLAPGININSTKNTGGYEFKTGTSMSAPHVAGAFALLQQFYKLQSGIALTPQQIKNALNNTGVLIDDSSESGYNFSRIDVYSAILSLDETSPNVSLISPANSLISQNANQTFSCNTTDELELANITFYLWNSAGIYNQTTTNISGTFNETSINITNLAYDNYKWNCLAYDQNGNSAFASSNFSLQIGNISLNLISPSNNTFTNQNQTFNCSAESNTETELTNMTFYLWNSTNLIYNSSKNISGTSNSTIFQYNFSNEINYHWNCQVYNNASQSAFAEENYTITYDLTFPDITSVSPFPDDETSNSASKIFQYNITDNFNIANCSLIVNGNIQLTNSSITNFSLTQNFTKSFSSGTYNWKINCTDRAGNQNSSVQKSFTITAITITTSGGGGGGGSSSISRIYTPTSEQTSGGYSKDLQKNDKIKFTFFDEMAGQHILTMNYIGKNFVNITIQSNPIKIVLGIGQSAKLNLTSPGYYDLYVKLESIINKKAKITIQTIHEEIPKPAEITGKTIDEEEGEPDQEDIEKKMKFLNLEIKKLKTIIYIFIPIFIIVVIILFIRRTYRRKQGNDKNETIKTKSKGE